MTRRGRAEPLPPEGTMSGAKSQYPDHKAKSGRFENGSEQSAGWDFSRQPRVPGHATWEWDIPADTVRFSEEWRDMIMLFPALDPDDVTPDAWWPHMHEDDVIPFQNEARKIIEGRGDRYRTLFRVRRGDGSWVWLLSRGRVVEKQGGKAVRVCGAIMDITDLRSDVKFQHKSMCAAGSDSHAMFENSPDLIVRMDQEMFPLYANPNIALHMAGCGNERPESAMPPLLGLTREQMEFLRKNVEKVFSDGVSVRELVTFATAYGHDVTGEYSFWPEFDGNGRVAAVMTQFRDITEQVLADRRAHLNEMRLDSLYYLTQMDNAAEEDVLRYVMASLIRLTGSESGFLFFPASYPGRAGRMVWSANLYPLLGGDALPADCLPAEFFPLIAGNNGKTPARTMRNGNSLHPVHLSFGGKVPVMRYIIAPVVDAERVACIAGVCNKETDYKEADLQQLEAFISGAWLILRRHEFIRELQHTKIAAEQASQVKDLFLANISHELRTPLNGVLCMLQLLDEPSLSQEQRDYARTATAAGQTLLRLISDILDFSRLQSGKTPLRNEVFNFKTTVESALGSFIREAEEKGLSFALKLDEAIPALLFGDADRVRQILYNVVGNAMKFTERGGIRVECSLLSQNSAGEVRLYLGIEDTGIGIAEDVQATIFDAFIQATAPFLRKNSGTGLGLSIVRRLVELMDGNIMMESEMGRGTTLHCVIRLSRPPAAALAALPALSPEPVRHKQRLDVLVAEDDDISRYAMRIFLQRAGHRPVCVDNGKAALEMLALYPFHCLFTDIQMPDMDGLELVRRIREGDMEGISPSEETERRLEEALPGAARARRAIPRDLTVVAFSAHAMQGDEERFLQAGMSYYISKPIIMRKMEHILAAVIARIRRPAECGSV